MKTAFTARLLEQLNALVARISDEEADRIAMGSLTLSLSLHDAGAKAKTFAVTGKKPKAVRIAACLDDAAGAIRACRSRQETRDLLKDLALKVADLKALIELLGRTPTGKKKADLESQIVEVIGREADSRAFR